MMKDYYSKKYFLEIYNVWKAMNSSSKCPEQPRLSFRSRTILGIFILLGIAINFVESLGPFFGALLFGLVGLCVGIYGRLKINNNRMGSNLTIEKTLDQINKWDLAKIKWWRPKQKHTFYCVYGTGLVGAISGLISGASVAG